MRVKIEFIKYEVENLKHARKISLIFFKLKVSEHTNSDSIVHYGIEFDKMIFEKVTYSGP